MEQRQYEPRDMSGTLFKNSNKGDNERRPDYRGDCLIDGVKYEIAAWIKEGKRGKFMSLSFKIPQPKPEAQPPQQTYEQRRVPRPQPAPNYADLNDDIFDVPF